MRETGVNCKTNTVSVRTRACLVDFIQSIAVEILDDDLRVKLISRLDEASDESLHDLVSGVLAKIALDLPKTMRGWINELSDDANNPRIKKQLASSVDFIDGLFTLIEEV